MTFGYVNAHYHQFILLKDHLLKTRCDDTEGVASDVGGVGVSEGLGPGNGRAVSGGNAK